MQVVNLPPQESSPGLHAISNAVLHNDGRIQVERGGKRFCTENTPDDALQLALLPSGLWCLTVNGKVYRLTRLEDKPIETDDADAPALWIWSAENIPRPVQSIGVLPDGRLCAAAKRCAFVPDQTALKSSAAVPGSNTNEGPPIRWVSDKAATEWLGLRPAFAKRVVPTFSLRTLIGATAFFALILGPIRAYRDVQQRVEAMQLLEVRGCTFTYAHELDEQGEPIENPEAPGPRWLSRLVGEEHLLKPIRMKHSDKTIRWSDVSKLTTLREISTSSTQSSFSFAALKPLKQLERLRLFRIELFDLNKLSELSTIKHLSLEYCHLPNETQMVGSEPKPTGPQLIEELQELQLESLTLRDVADIDLEQLVALPSLRNLNRLDIRAHNLDITAATKLPRLEHLHVDRVNSLKPFKNLSHLKSLSIDCGGPGRQSPYDLRHLKQLQFLEIRNSGNIADTEWTSEMRDLETLRLWGVDHVVNLDSLTSLSKLRDFSIEKPTCLPAELIETTPLTVAAMSRPYYFSDTRTSVFETTLRLDHGNFKDIRFVSDFPRLYVVDFSDNQITDVSPLSKLKLLRECNLSGNPLHDISPLTRNRNLDELNLSATKVSDLSPLAGFERMKKLDLSGLKIENIEALSGLPLKTLSLAHTPINNLDALSSIASLSELDLSHSKVNDVSMIRQLPNLQRLSCSGLPITEVVIHPQIASMERLDLRDTLVADLSNLPTNAKHVDLHGTPIRKLDGIGDWIQTTTLDISGTAVRDLTPLEQLFNLESLDLSDTAVDDISALKQHRRLRKLKLRNTRIASDEDLRSLMPHLEEIDLSGTTIESFSAFTNRKSQTPLTVDLSNTPITDLSPLKSLSLRSLNVNGCKLPNLDGIGTFSNPAYGTRATPNELQLLDTGIRKLDSKSMEQIKKVEVLSLDCTNLKDLMPLHQLYLLKRLHLDQVSPTHDFEWLKSTRNLNSLTITGEPIKSDSHSRLFEALSQSPRLRELRLPAGSTIDGNKYAVLRTMAVYVDGNRHDFGPLDDSDDQGKNSD